MGVGGNGGGGGLHGGGEVWAAREALRRMSPTEEVEESLAGGGAYARALAPAGRLGVAVYSHTRTITPLDSSSFKPFTTNKKARTYYPRSQKP